MKLLPENAIPAGDDAEQLRRPYLRAVLTLAVYGVGLYLMAEMFFVPTICLCLVPMALAFFYSRDGLAACGLALLVTLIDLSILLPGWPPVWVALAVYLPALLALIYSMSKGKSFWGAVGLQIGVTLLSLVALLVALRLMMPGESLVSQLTEAAVNLLATHPDGDMYLSALYMFGMLRLPDSLVASSATVGGLLAMTDAIRTALLNDLRSFLSLMLTAFIPTTLVSFPVFGGTASAAIAARYAAMDGTLPFARVPLAKWCLPKSVGGPICGLAVGYVLPMFSNAPALLMTSYLMQAAFGAIMAVQGLATMEFIGLRRGKRAVGRRLLALLLLVVFQLALTILGVIDQITDMRGIRRGIHPPGAPRPIHRDDKED